MVCTWWASYQFFGTPSFILAGKLKALKQDMKKWNLEVFGHIDNQKSSLLEELQDLERRELLGETSEEVLLRKGTVLANLERVLLSKEISWRQKSRALWLKEGDKCTKYFHKVANSHQCSNAIESLHSDNQVISSASDLENHITNYYERLFSEPAGWRPKLDTLSFKTIDPQSVITLERPFEKDKIYKVISGMAKDKAPGLDGFSMGFFQTCWDIVKGDVLQVFSEFLSFQKFKKSLNATFIALIPKRHGLLLLRISTL
ncbi:hypothetical protein I3842_04G079300 [Carya illinoinensis]|uniref:Reverse transcriptase n=1 Tax=Carya illinoinensis TaxID=32201 RepID=A0A922F6S5_CARIL|nr:hypothetical protein I3842_04G079300 [Carya illinoinensis]